MKKISTVILILAFMASLAGCSVEEKANSNEYSNNVSAENTDTEEKSLQTSNDDKVGENSPKSKNPENVSLISEKDSTVEGTSSIPLHEPTILVGLDGETIYTDEISEAYGEVHEAYGIHDEPITVDMLTEDNEGATAFCEGFQYFREPEGSAFNSYNNPELFTGYEFLGEVPENKNEWKRLNVGDEICGLKLVNATVGFRIWSYDYERFNSYYDSGYRVEPTAEFEGTVEIDGFFLLSPRTARNPDGGEFYFYPTENRLPILGKAKTDEDFSVDCVTLTDEFFCFNEIGKMELDSSTITYKDIDGMDVGDAAFVHVTLSNIKYYGYEVGQRYNNIRAELEDIEVLDVLAHVEDYPVPQNLPYPVYVPPADNMTQDIGEKIELTGTPLDSGSLKKFSYETLYESTKAELTANEPLMNVLIELDNPEISEKLYRGTALTKAFVNKNLSERENLEYPARIETESGTFYEKGVTYDSFYSAICDVFTESSVRQMLDNMPFFINYNNELYQQSIGISRDTTIVHTEYEIVKNDDTEVEFDTVNYCVELDSGIKEYDESKRDEYIIKRLPNRFIKTDNGFKVVEIAGFYGDKSSLTGE